MLSVSVASPEGEHEVGQAIVKHQGSAACAEGFEDQAEAEREVEAVGIVATFLWDT